MYYATIDMVYMTKPYELDICSRKVSEIENGWRKDERAKDGVF